MDILKKWKVYCVTEGTFVETWRSTRPVCCPNNPRHTLDTSQITVIDSKIVESDTITHTYINAKSYQDTHGYYMIEGLKFNIQCPSGTDVYMEDIIMPTKRCIYGMKIYVTEQNLGDTLSIMINPGMVVGVLTANVNIGDTVIPVSDTVVANVIPGFDIRIGTEEVMIISVDTNSIVIDKPLQNAYDAMTLVKLYLHLAKEFRMDVTGTHKIGYGTMGGKVLPLGTIIHIHYHNNTPMVSKIMTTNYEYTY